MQLICHKNKHDKKTLHNHTYLKKIIDKELNEIKRLVFHGIENTNKGIEIIKRIKIENLELKKHN